MVTQCGALPQEYGPVVQLVRTLACHARGRRFEPVPGRQYAAMAQSVERVLGKDEVTSSNLVSSSKNHGITCRDFLFYGKGSGIPLSEVTPKS